MQRCQRPGRQARPGRHRNMSPGTTRATLSQGSVVSTCLASSCDCGLLSFAVLVPTPLTHGAKTQRGTCNEGAHTEEGTPSCPARFGDASNNRCSSANVKFPTGKIVEEEEGLCPLCQDIVHTHGNQVLANGTVLVALLGNLRNSRNIHGT